MTLTRITEPPTVQRPLVYDLEWFPKSLELRLIGVYDGKRYRSYTTVGAFLDSELTRETNGKWFYAHAGGLADAQFLLEKFIKRPEFQVRGFFSGSSAVLIPVQRGRLQWTFVDSYWLLRAKLADIAKWSGRAKGGKEYTCADYPKCDHDGHCIFWAPMGILKEYNELDCVILWHAIIEFQERLRALGGELRMTLASSALNLFRRKYLKRDIFTARALNQRAEASYVASRVEVFEQKCDGANSYDINSSFPYAMLAPVPGLYLGASNQLPEKERATFLADVEVCVPETYLPPLPYKHGARVFFPHGAWRAWLTAPDVELLLRAGGTVRTVYEVLHFEPFSDLADYVQDLYERRRSSTDEFDRATYKLLLNSLYGKFAEGEEKTSLLLNPLSPDCPHTPRCYRDACTELLFPGAYLQTTVKTPPHAHVVMSSHITAVSRSTLFWKLQACERVFYTDTDSIVTTQNLPIYHAESCKSADCAGCQLGSLKFEGRIQEGYFAAPKLYRVDGKVRAKGFSGMTPEKFQALLDGKEVDFLRMARIRENFRAGRSAPIEQVYKKKLQLKSQPKRCYLKKGGSRPWELNEIL